ncbi:low molecular weight phosphotyrosine protein phosphatase 1-like isoform X1 [Lucilia cuprina]|uniref:low molecular weight phosphotyrosine protein phosphatase 1-like isoform X1 n=1 Tax=Lucilia cuprina TaxID=7375 RepID=UPI001F06CEC4|nr:low molecular weight phosphotyrosine protein phosphatase 1-like isoform X1 [Lucilia cuprina]
MYPFMHKVITRKTEKCKCMVRLMNHGKRNTCRSPIAEAVMIATIKKYHVYEDWEVDSAAIADWHVGKEPNIRSMNIMKTYKLPYKNRARQIKASDFNEFDYIFGMDLYNMAKLDACMPQGSKAKLLMLGEFGLPESDRIIEDPYCARTDAAFEKVYQQCVVACEAFLQKALANEI